MNKNYWLAGIFAIIAFLMRTQGILLMIAIVLCLALRRQYRPAAILSAVFLPWVVVFGFGKYGGDFLSRNPYDPAAGQVGLAELVARFVDNFGHYCFGILPQAILPWTSWQGISVVAGVVLLLMAIRGWRDTH